MAVKSVKQLVGDAGKSVEALSGQEAAKLVGDPGVLFVDIREGEELQKTGRLRGAVRSNSRLIQAAPPTSRNLAKTGSWFSIVLPAGAQRLPHRH